MYLQYWNTALNDGVEGERKKNLGNKCQDTGQSHERKGGHTE